MSVVPGAEPTVEIPNLVSLRADSSSQSSLLHLKWTWPFLDSQGIVIPIVLHKRMTNKSWYSVKTRQHDEQSKIKQNEERGGGAQSAKII